MKRSRLRSMSPKKQAQMEEYFPRAVAFKKRKPICEVCRKRKTKDVHHRAGRLGPNLLDEDTWTAVCRRCHDWIHDHPKEARAAGLLV
jgi:hypothetical protein